MKSFKQITEGASIKDFKKLLNAYDWWYSYSDDNSVYKKGSAQSSTISKMFRELLNTSDKEDAVKAYIATAKKNGDTDTANHLKKEYL